MNFDCVFPSCNYKSNDIEEEEFLMHLKSNHSRDIEKIAKKENIPVSMIEMITVSNSKVFINS